MGKQTAPAQGKSKVVKSSKGEFAKGGKGHMFGKQHAGPQKPGTTAHDTKGDGGKFPKGGKGHMFGKGRATQARPGFAGKASNG